ncbi:GNAT family N-acetyltransferase [Ornithinimicrobium sp. W1679]|uniref:GNAT family N-acetyltransferase n=1 Tax=unclassified Ornithinimicrobium TaxID=2615080 RepID=UPI003CEE3306
MPCDLPALQRVFRAAALSNAGDLPLLRAHPELLAFAGAGVAGGRTRVAMPAAGDGRIVGFATVVADPLDGLELEDLFVDPAWHRRGIARALVLDAVATARKAGHRRLGVDGNPHALGFYRAVGFIEVEQLADGAGAGMRLMLDLDGTG